MLVGVLALSASHPLSSSPKGGAKGPVSYTHLAATVGTVLPGVTRRSCIELLKDWGYEVVEGTIPGSSAGIKYYLLPDFSKFSFKTVCAAMGQMFYSTIVRLLRF